MCLSMEVQPHPTCVFLLQPVLRGSGPLELSFSSKQVRAAPLVFIATSWQRSPDPGHFPAFCHGASW